MTSNGEEDQSVKKSGELKIKLKYQEEEDFLEDQDQDQNNPSTTTTTNNNKRICHFCGKGFASGKALGGHMRIHFQVHKQPSSSNSKKKLKPTKKRLPKNPSSSSSEEDQDQNITLSDFAKKSENINDDNPIRCYLCFKTFPSMKSLFGHMRCHPDRDQRGYNPPPRPPPRLEQEHLGPQLDSTNEEEEDQVDLMKSLRGCNWVVTAKRGSKGISKKPILDDDDDKEFLDAANELMRLAHGSGAIDEHEATNSNSLEPISGSKKKRRRFEEIEGLIEMGNNKAAAAVSDDNEAGRSVQCPSKSSNGKVIMLKKKKKRKKIKDLEFLGEDIVSPVVVVGDKAMGTAAAATPDDKYYRCSSCDKSFPTYQALGGHRSSHNNKIKVLEIHHNSIDDHENLVLEENEIAAAAANNGNFSTPPGRRKLSDQALSSHITSVGELSNTCGGGRGVLEFDLNEVPPMEDEGTGGLASSSINSVDQFSVFESSSIF